MGECEKATDVVSLVNLSAALQEVMCRRERDFTNGNGSRRLPVMSFLRDEGKGKGGAIKGSWLSA
jgi:hypothetical protein